MKTPLFSLLSLLAFIAGASAGSSPHFGASFSATISTAVSTGSNTSVLKVTRISNATIFSQLVASGSFAGVTPAQMALVLNPLSTNYVDVINKSTHDVLMTLVSSGTASNLNGLAKYGNTGGKEFAIADVSYLVHLPDGTTWETNAIVRGSGIGPILDPLFSFSASFAGGNGDAVLQGTIHKQPKVYIY